MKVLHILNGDMTLQAFQKAKLKGDFIVWRELLSEGPVLPMVDQKEFWEQRAIFAQTEWGATAADYQQKVLFELALLSTFNCYDEIICWFDHDLVCQFNFLAICQWLENKKQTKTKITLLANQQPAQITDFYAFSDLQIAQLHQLLQTRKTISPSIIQQAAQLWKCYASTDPRSMLKQLSEEVKTTLPYLERAIRLHLKRFPSLQNGLNQTETQLLKTLSQQSIKNKKVLIQKILAQDTELGITDLRLHAYVQRLQPLLYQNGQLALNDIGKQVLEGKMDFMTLQHQQKPIHWGGATNQEYRWDQIQKRLTPSI